MQQCVTCMYVHVGMCACVHVTCMYVRVGMCVRVQIMVNIVNCGVLPHLWSRSCHIFTFLFPFVCMYRSAVYICVMNETMQFN